MTLPPLPLIGQSSSRDTQTIAAPLSLGQFNPPAAYPKESETNKQKNLIISSITNHLNPYLVQWCSLPSTAHASLEKPDKSFHWQFIWIFNLNLHINLDVHNKLNTFWMTLGHLVKARPGPRWLQAPVLSVCFVCCGADVWTSSRFQAERRPAAVSRCGSLAETPPHRLTGCRLQPEPGAILVSEL